MKMHNKFAELEESGDSVYDGDLELWSYKYPLPEHITEILGSVYLTNEFALGSPSYGFSLPRTLEYIQGNLSLGTYKHKLPLSLKKIGGDLLLHGYRMPLPARLSEIGGYLSLSGYEYPMPAGLKSVGGDLYLKSHSHPLPAGLTKVGGDLILEGYDHPLPAGLRSVGGDLFLKHYDHPLPEGLTSVGGNLDLRGYRHPLPAGLTSMGGEIVGADKYFYQESLAQFAPKASDARSFGRKSAAVLKLRKPETPRSAREFKRMYSAEFEALKQDTQGRDFSEPIISQIKERYATPFDWKVTTGEYTSHLQRLCDVPNKVIKLNIDLRGSQFTDRERKILKAIRETSATSGHPTDRYPFFTIGWVRYCEPQKTKTILVEEVQSDIQGVRKGLQDPAARRQLESGGVDAEEIEAATDLLLPYTERFYEDALGIIFDIAQQSGSRVEMLHYDTKRQFGSPSAVYTDLPRSMGMKLSPGSDVLPGHDNVKQTWKITPNRRKTSRRPARRTSRRARRTSRR